MSKQTSTEVTKADTSIFHLLDGEDEQQIFAEAQGRLKQALVYKINAKNTATGKYEERSELSYAGIQHICLMMAQRHEEFGSLELVDEPTIKRESFEIECDGKPQKIQKWYASCVVRNTKTRATAPGASEASIVSKQIKIDPKTNKKVWNNDLNSYEYEERYDDFGRTKALSKAFRNACKPFIPVKLILEMIKIAEEQGQTKSFDDKPSSNSEKTDQLCTCDPNVRNPNDIPIASKDSKIHGLLSCKTCSYPISRLVSDMIIEKRGKEQSTL